MLCMLCARYASATRGIPRFYDNVTFVWLHGGFPYESAAIWLAARKNVYLDSSLMGVLLIISNFERGFHPYCSTVFVVGSTISFCHV
jgi:hypothetical protein